MAEQAPGDQGTFAQSTAMRNEAWQPTPTLRVLLWWTTVTTIASWLVVVRGAFDGPTYEWGLAYFGHSFSGKGLQGDYWLPLTRLLLGWSILVLGWRGARSVSGYLLAAWQIFGFASAMHAAITSPEQFRFRGDTLGIDVSLAWVAPLLYGIATALAVRWFILDRHKRLHADPGLTVGNHAWLGVMAVLVLVAFALLHYGPPDGPKDRVGVVLTVLLWLMLPLAIRLRTLRRDQCT